jgi:hypothetical protein
VVPHCIPRRNPNPIPRNTHPPSPPTQIMASFQNDPEVVAQLQEVRKRAQKVAEIKVGPSMIG